MRRWWTCRSRRADEDDELLILDLKVEVGNGRGSCARVDLVDVLAANRSHESASLKISVVWFMDGF